MAAVADAVDDVVDAARAALERGLREARSGAGDKPVRPFVTLSFAQSLDGCVARERGQPYALSSRESLVMTHRLRAMHAGILVGVGTVLADNPALTVRLCDGASPRPVVLDSTLRTPPSAKVCERAPLLLHVRDESAEMRTRREALVRRGAETIECSALANGRVDLADALSRLAARVPSLMVEGGAEVITALLEARTPLWDQLVLTVAPKLIGGLRAVTRPLPEPLELNVRARQFLGPDLVIQAERASQPALQKPLRPA